MLDLKYVLANARGRQAELPRPQRPGRRSWSRTRPRRRRWRAGGKGLLQEVEDVRRRQNEVAQATGKEKDPDRRAELVAEGKRLKAEVADSEETLRQLEDEIKAPARPHPQPDPPRRARRRRPRTDSRELRKVGTPRAFDFTPKDHVEIGKALDLIDFEAGGKVAGHGLLLPQERRRAAGPGPPAVRHPEAGRRRVHADHHARPGPEQRSSRGSASRPAGAETQIYSVEDTDLSLIGTAEITLGGMHADEILDEAQLPLKYVGLSHCFRTEAGAAGRASRGLYRVHQFTKVEMFAFTDAARPRARCTPELLAIEEEIFPALGIPYRVLDICSGDLGGPAYRKFDLEAWMPGRGEAGEYGEVTSTSDCTDYQARRLEHPLPARRPEGDPVRPHAQRHRRRPQPGPDRRSSRTTSGPTAWSTCPRSCGRSWART